MNVFNLFKARPRSNSAYIARRRLLVIVCDDRINLNDPRTEFAGFRSKK